MRFSDVLAMVLFIFMVATVECGLKWRVNVNDRAYVIGVEVEPRK